MILPQDKIAVCAQPGLLDKAKQIDGAMKFLGLNILRIRAPRTKGTQSYSRLYRPLIDMGYRFGFTHNPGIDPIAEVGDMVTVDRMNPGNILFYEGPNEPDSNPVTFEGLADIRIGHLSPAEIERNAVIRAANDAAKASKGKILPLIKSPSGWPASRARGALALMKRQRDVLRSVPELAHVDVVAFNDYCQAEQRAFTNLANSHIYPRGSVESRIGQFHKLVDKHGRGAGIITELGYQDAMGKPWRAAPPVKPAQIVEYWRTGIPALLADPKVKMFCIYSLVDGDGAGEQDNYGLFEADFTPKAQAYAVREAIRAAA